MRGAQCLSVPRQSRIRCRCRSCTNSAAKRYLLLFVSFLSLLRDWWEESPATQVSEQLLVRVVIMDLPPGLGTKQLRTHLAVLPEIHCTALGCSYRMAVMDSTADSGSLYQSIRRQLSAMPHELYLIRLIHHQTHRAFPGERLWTADQLANTATIRFLRARNLEGCDVYIQPYGGKQNAGYILVDLDVAQPSVIADMCANGHDPCVVLQTSPRHLPSLDSPQSAPAGTGGGDRCRQVVGVHLWR